MPNLLIQNIYLAVQRYTYNSGASNKMEWYKKETLE